MWIEMALTKQRQQQKILPSHPHAKRSCDARNLLKNSYVATRALAEAPHA
jgi:hypothetical protein